MKRWLLIISMLLAGVVSMTSLANDNVPGGWEVIKAESAGDAKIVVKEAELEIRTAPLSIYIVAPHQVQIKVFTILGRLVSDQNVPAGTSRLNLPAHGVYIIKAGTLTCKVAV